MPILLSSMIEYKSVNINKCPCESSVNYNDCCQPFHQQTAIPETAEQLMRSRYSAFVLGLIDYIVATTVPSQQSLLDKVAIENWSRQTHWRGLAILKHTPKICKRHAQVEFKAFFSSEDGENEKKAHHELSAFVKIGQGEKSRWYFIDPTLVLPTLKQPCICGSGEKFKRCCGAFL